VKLRQWNHHFTGAISKVFFSIPFVATSMVFLVLQQATLSAPQPEHLWEVTSVLAFPKPLVAIVVAQPLHPCLSYVAETGVVPLVVTSVRVTHSDVHFGQDMAVYSVAAGADEGRISCVAPPFAPSARTSPARLPSNKSAAASPVIRAALMIRVFMLSFCLLFSRPL
jgi:hypothetical protein